MLESRELDLAPAHARFALGYACACTWAVVLLFSSAFGAPSEVHAASASMLPGLVACLCSVVFFKAFPSISGRTPFVTAAGVLMAAGTFLCTHPMLAAIPGLRPGGLALSGFFAIIVVMSWFDTFANLAPRIIIILAGCALSIAAAFCWALLSCPAETASVLSSALPLLSAALLPKPHEKRPQATVHDGSRTLREVVAAAVPVRTLIGLAVTFFIVRSIATLAPEFEQFNAAVSPASLIIPLCITAFFIASALLVKKRIDPSILYKILLSCFAGCVFLLASSTGITAALVFYANLTAEVMMWTVLALWARKTPVKPHLVFAIGWMAECAGNTLGQAAMPLFAGDQQLFFAVAIAAILLAVGFAFSEGHLVLDVDFEVEDRPVRLGNTPEYDSVETAGAACGSPVSQQCPAGAQGSDGQKEAQEGDRAVCGDADGGRPSTDAKPASVRTAKQPVQEKPDRARDENDPLSAFAAAHDISPRERDVLELWIAGRGMKYIENALFISESTVKSHLRSIYRKCDTHNRDETISLYEKETSDA